MPRRIGRPTHRRRNVSLVCYYYLAILLNTDDGKASAGDVEMHAKVAKPKATFFRFNWNSYATAALGTVRLISNEAPPSFEYILAKIAVLQGRICG